MTIWQVGILLFHFVIAPLAAGHALLYKRDSRAALGWISVSILFPVVGPVLYYIFGINRIRTRAKQISNIKHQAGWIGYERGEVSIFEPATLKDRVDSNAAFDAIRLLADSMTKKPLTGGNSITLLHNGEETYPRMLDSIAAAKSSVYLMTYILETNAIGQQFIDALAHAAKNGIDVRVMVDGLGDLYSWPRSSRILKKRGVKTTRFLPPTLWPPTLKINLRNHRKLLIVDGDVGFSGGMNIGDRHLIEKVGNPKPTQDIHFEFTGPINQQLHMVFAQTWEYITKEEFPDFKGQAVPTGSAVGRVITDGPDENLDKLELIMVGAIAAANTSIRIMTPYFIPSREMISVLKIAAMRGVEVEIILPRTSNINIVQWASQNMLGELLAHGVNILKQPDPFSHSKLLLIDEDYALIGSANIDPRSLRLNFEVGIEMYQAECLEVLARHFENVISKSEKYVLAELDNRHISVRLRDAFFWLFSPYL